MLPLVERHRIGHRRIGVIGTEATIASECYQRRISDLAPDAVVCAVACPLFVPLVEQGMLEGEIVDKIIEHYLAPLAGGKIDTLILGCTHYPLLFTALRKFFGANVHIVECSRAIADELSRLLDSSGTGRGSTSAVTAPQFFVTDAVSRFNNLTRLCLKDVEVSAEKVSLG